MKLRKNNYNNSHAPEAFHCSSTFSKIFPRSISGVLYVWEPLEDESWKLLIARTKRECNNKSIEISYQYMTVRYILRTQGLHHWCFLMNFANCSVQLCCTIPGEGCFRNRKRKNNIALVKLCPTSLKLRKQKDQNNWSYYHLNPIQNGAFSGLLPDKGQKALPSLKSVSYTLPEGDPKTYINQVTHQLISADISISSTEIGNFCYIKKYRYTSHFNI